MSSLDKDLKSNYNDIKQDVRHLVKDAKKGFKNAKHVGIDRVSDAQDQAKEYVSHVNHTVSQSVKQNPLLAVGVAALTGAVLALILCK